MSVDIEEITSLGTRVLDRILKPVYDRIAEVAKRVETLEHHVFDQPKGVDTGGASSVRSASSYVTVSPASLLASAPAATKPEPEAEPEPEAAAEPEEEQPAAMPSPQVAGDLEGDEHEPAA